MLRVSVNKVLQSNKRFLKELFDAITLDVLVATGSIRVKQLLLEEIDNVVEETLNDTVLPAIQRNLVDNNSIFTSTLYNALKFSTPKPGTVALEVGEAKKYALILEKGSGGPRSIDPTEAGKIIRWVSSKRRVDLPTATKVAEHVIKRIETTGNVPHPYIEPALQLMMPVATDVVRQRLAEVLRP